MKNGFMQMVFSTLGIVLYVTMFGSIMTALAALLAVAGVTNFIAFATIVGIAPTILLLGGIFGAGFTFYQGYKKAGVSDASGLMRVVLGVLMIILFVTLFATIATSFVTLNTTYGSNTTWVAFGTVITIVPTVLFLSGIFAGAMTAYSGYKAHGKKK